MKLFISHSGPRSRMVAAAVKDLVGSLIQAVDPWISTSIEKGARWGPEISKNLGEAQAGIVCLTAENLAEPWLLFEAGALAKHLDGRVCTLLLGVEVNTIRSPLDQFQHTVPEREDVWKLVMQLARTAREGTENVPNDERLLQLYQDYFWTQFERAIASASSEPSNVPTPPSKTVDELVAEVHAVVLDLSRRHDELATRIGSDFGVREIVTPRTLSEQLAATRRAILAADDWELVFPNANRTVGLVSDTAPDSAEGPDLKLKEWWSERRAHRPKKTPEKPE